MLKYFHICFSDCPHKTSRLLLNLIFRVDKSTQFLEPEDVAEAIVEAVLIDQRVLFVPKMMYIVNVLKR